MRIIDWSSYVCSSDLHEPGQPVGRLRQRSREAILLSADRGGRLQVVAFQIAVERGVGRGPVVVDRDRGIGGADDRRRKDRKRALEGTRVAVHVDPGGRRLNKKNNNKSTAVRKD